MNEKCSKCGSAPEMRTGTITDYDGTETQQVPLRCPNPESEYHDRANLDFDWLVPA
ncbi:hypothetical protein [Amnibacterium kyonggiense]|uniref:Uncharacterized protein n=1 Tax=Amnibacterium kyonggiense TaxID=595671 RepID=A0A4R7FTA4_9MICO|nr:hypothetical protein [Amnibacterium kyonggiense]TDS81117.1 hypothetical protein CLV52_1693 [Amnibacterium kyonggiense]